MKNLFDSIFGIKTKEQFVQPEKFIDVMEVVSNKYPQVVQDIHNEFLTAGDRLLKQAQEIINSITIKNQDKVSQLSSLGFTAVKEVTETKEQIQRKAQQEAMSNAIIDFKREYPNNKFITEDAVKQICQKYGLILGENTQFKGFVPQKNLDDMERFFNNHEEDRFRYYTVFTHSSMNMRGGRMENNISKDEYDNHIQHEQEKMERERIERNKSRERGLVYAYDMDLGLQGSQWKTTFHKGAVKLFICAPLKDMHTQGYNVQGHRLVKDVPDPIVLLPKVHNNGVKGYIILTAWGDEANDPLVINENNN